MNGNTELLNYIYQNCQMGVESLNHLLEISKDEKLNVQMNSQLREYKCMCEKACNKLKELGHEEKGIGNMAKISTYMSISAKTLMDKTPCHMAEMLIQGSTMGIIDVTKNIKKYQDADIQIVKLADNLLKEEQKNIEDLKCFLK